MLARTKEKFMMKTALAVACLLAALPLPASAQSYPNRPIRLIVGFPPGGAVDIIARIYAQGLSARLGQPVVVENKPGTGGNLASDTVAKAAPDGYTLLHGTENVFISNPHIYGARMPFDPFKDVVPVTSLVSNQVVLTSIQRRRQTTCANSSIWPRRASRRCSMRRSATAATIIWRWKCSSSTSALNSLTCPIAAVGLLRLRC